MFSLYSHFDLILQELVTVHKVHRKLERSKVYIEAKLYIVNTCVIKLLNIKAIYVKCGA